MGVLSFSLVYERVDACFQSEAGLLAGQLVYRRASIGFVREAKHGARVRIEVLPVLTMRICRVQYRIRGEDPSERARVRVQ